MDVTIFGTVRDKERSVVKISIHNDEIEALIKKKAIDAGVKGYEGRIFSHYDERIATVVINN